MGREMEKIICIFTKVEQTPFLPDPAPFKKLPPII
jgi:hypothetical protein